MDTGTLAAAAMTLALLAGTLWGVSKWARSGFAPPRVAARLCLRTGLLSGAAVSTFALLLAPRIPLLWDHQAGIMAAMLTVLLMGLRALRK